MTVIVVGGAGGMGRHAVRAIARLGTAKRLLIADLDLARASLLADEVGPIAEPVQLDATDEASMRAAFAECDVVLNTMGPFTRFGTPILCAALESGCDYLDIDDDWQSTVEALGLDGFARQGGRRVVVGIGASPGTTNMCARLAAERLDVVDELFTGWSLGEAVVEPEAAYPSTSAAAAAEHWLLQCTGKIRAWAHGAPADIDPLARVDLAFPGIGTVHAYTMGHPEPVTLPISYPALRRSVNLQAGPDELIDQLRTVAAKFEAGALSAADAADLIDSRPAQPGPAETPALPNLWALARGSRNGRPMTIAAYPRHDLPGRMGGHTGIPLAIGLELLRRGKIAEPGVHAPEKAFTPMDFFELYAQFTTEPTATMQDLLAVEETSD
ncbi:saccharopine dehydrogenase family protein [Nocardia africana]|uniref:saccharopine dehydrogenase family protein n=1 Tax=Nocardia africana TaxID=134964 RepID=UPI000FE1C3EE|nr:saccharopine dehydrogenase NADP-binding domain-containing protein [Nocardia africana]MCC3313721.1 saccharopine dehydrogenase NADP-binding domain-containing protein [Nocardia africana]